MNIKEIITKATEEIDLIKSVIAALEKLSPQPAAPAAEATPCNSGKPRRPYHRRNGNGVHRHAKPARSAKATAAGQDKPVTMTELVREACAKCVEPFTRVEVWDYVEKHYPERKAELSGSSVDSAMFRMRQTGELIEAGSRPGIAGPLKLHKRSLAMAAA